MLPLLKLDSPAGPVWFRGLRAKLFDHTLHNIHDISGDCPSTHDTHVRTHTAQLAHSTHRRSTGPPRTHTHTHGTHVRTHSTAGAPGLDAQLRGCANGDRRCRSPAGAAGDIPPALAEPMVRRQARERLPACLCLPACPLPSATARRPGPSRHQEPGSYASSPPGVLSANLRNAAGTFGGGACHCCCGGGCSCCMGARSIAGGGTCVKVVAAGAPALAAPPKAAAACAPPPKARHYNTTHICIHFDSSACGFLACRCGAQAR